MTCVLWRQDDNGQRFPVATFERREQAEDRLETLSRGAHRQFYWIEKMPPIPDLASIRKALADHRPRLASRREFPHHRHAAVALLLREQADQTEILFLLRAHHDQDPWSGDIGFPGGHIEAGDSQPRLTAERETAEEIGLDLRNAVCLGQLDDIAGAHLPIIISCFVYLLERETKLQLNQEVVETFWVPLARLCDPGHHRLSTVRFRDEILQRPAIDLLGPGRTVLWGITYRLTVQFLALIGRQLPDTPLP